MRELRFCHALLLSLFAVCAESQTAQPERGVEVKIDSLLKQLALEEKTDMIGGVDDVYIHEVKRIGMRFLRMADGPLALRNYGPAMTFGVSDAATWDPELAKRLLAIAF